jgi:glycosyltransferase involved in cell wall biosynthesis
MTHLSVNHSGALATVSEFTRQEVVERFHVSPDRVSVIYPGINETIFPPAEGNGRPYLFFVGNLERRKNLTRLVEAYAQFRRSSGLPHQLILAGIPGFGWHQTQEAISTCGFEKDIIVPGYLSRDEVLKLYSGAAAFIFPSLYEGFGLPLLEAMSAGIPVACSSVGAVKEVAGSAALFFDPRDVEEIASAIERVVSSDTLRGSLRQLGYERVKLFSWALCAQKYNELYQNTIGAQRTASAS